MRKYIPHMFVVLFMLPMVAQARVDTTLTEAAGGYGIAHTNVLKVYTGYGRQLDTYLSPMAYHGMHVGIGNEWWQAFRCDTRLGRTGRLANWGHVGRIHIAAGSALNTANSNRIRTYQLAAGWGAFYCWKWYDGRLKLHVGPYMEGNFGIRVISSNVNKPVSFDIGIDLMAMSGVSWSWYGRKTSYRLNYLVRTNIVGFDFMPDYWQSYYEIATGVPGNARCSGHWNHHVVKHELSIDMQFRHSTWRVGAEHAWNDYGTSNLHFDRNQISIVIGCIWKYRINANARL